MPTPSRFDKFLEGDGNALTKAEQAGLKTFIDKGCAACHNGVNLGGSMQAFEVAGKYKFAKLGGFKGDKNGMVKTPTLRNVEETAPYFHNGAIWSLQDAIKEMGSTQLGITISDDEEKVWKYSCAHLQAKNQRLLTLNFLYQQKKHQNHSYNLG